METLERIEIKTCKKRNLNYITNIQILKNYGHIRKYLEWKSFIVEILTRVGVIFPNYEDHLLDKKKISKCFSGNFHEMLCPLNYTSKECPWQYHSSQDNKYFIDLIILTWNGKIRVTNKKDPNSPVITANQTKDITCSVVNNFIHSTVSKIKYQLNNFLLDSAPKRATVTELTWIICSHFQKEQKSKV